MGGTSFSSRAATGRGTRLDLSTHLAGEQAPGGVTGSVLVKTGFLTLSVGAGPKRESPCSQGASTGSGKSRGGADAAAAVRCCACDSGGEFPTGGRGRVRTVCQTRHARTWLSGCSVSGLMRSCRVVPEPATAETLSVGSREPVSECGGSDGGARGALRAERRSCAVEDIAAQVALVSSSVEAQGAGVWSSVMQ